MFIKKAVRGTEEESAYIDDVLKANQPKRRAFGFRNMECFRLKIMQLCGYLNSRFIYHPNQLLALI